MNNIESIFKFHSAQEQLSHHDVVFNAPVHDPISGMPIGNGDNGCLIWTEADRLHIAINKTDLWDNVNSSEDCISQLEDENAMVCRHGAHMTIDFGCPAFEVIYQNQYENRISLYDATATISSDTPFCKTEITAFSSREYDVSIIDVNVGFSEDIPIVASLSRWGSRTFRMWYQRYKPGCNYGLEGTTTDVSDGIMKIIQKLNGTNFCVAVLPVSCCDLKIDSAGSHTARAYSGDNEKHKITFFYSGINRGYCRNGRRRCM